MYYILFAENSTHHHLHADLHAHLHAHARSGVELERSHGHDDILAHDTNSMIPLQW